MKLQVTEQMNSAPETVCMSSVTDSSERVQHLNTGWKFKLGNASGAENIFYDDSLWDLVNLPHDFSINQPFTTSGEAQSAYKLGGEAWYRKTFQVDQECKNKCFRLDFDGVYMDSTVWINGHLLGTHPYGYSPFAFDITQYIKFSEYNTITVRVNAQVPNSRWYSGAGIGRDVDLIVTHPIYVQKDGVKIATPNLASELGGNASVQLTTAVVNSLQTAVSAQIKQIIYLCGETPEQKIASANTERSIAAGSTDTFTVTAITTEAPKLWDITSPHLYVVRTQVLVDKNIVDTYETTFGFRFFNFDAQKGFSLNGKRIKIKGVCLHQDQGALGSVSYADAINRQIQILKQMGVNAIRTSHNTPCKELVAACNTQGMLLDYEFFDGWTSHKNGNSNDYARFFSKEMGESELIGAKSGKTWAQFDLESSINRDYNAPSIVMWSLGNEMTEGTLGISRLPQVQADLIAWAKAADQSRPITTADNQLRLGSSELNPQAIADANGLVGLNYAGGAIYDWLHNLHPDWKLIGSETASSVNSRGIYHTYGVDDASQQLSAYDYSCVDWGHYASQAWYDVLIRDFIAGEFVWTGFDYLGEPTPWNGVDSGAKGKWPSPKNSYFGIVDTAGLPKDSYYFYQSQWNDSVHTLHLLPAWNKNVIYKNPDGTVDVVVYTDAQAVRLYFTQKGSTERKDLGLKSFTTKSTSINGFSYKIYEGPDKSNDESKNLYLTWKVPYAEGVISAEAYDEAGNVVDTSSWEGRQTLITTGNPNKLTASPNRETLSANGSDLLYVTVDIVDKDGNRVPGADNKVTFEVSGAGRLVGLDNGSSPDHQSYQDNNRNVFSGQLVGIVQAAEVPGKVDIRISSEGLESTAVTIPVSAVDSKKTCQKEIKNLLYSRFLYVKLGSSVTLPQWVKVCYSDGTVKDEEVIWDDFDAEKCNFAGTFVIYGDVAGTRISVVVVVLNNIVALLNYSATTPVGQKPQLPDARPVIQADGIILKTLLPVTWDAAPKDAFDHEGTVVISGRANVFGSHLLVTASIRVQKEQLILGQDIASSASISLNGFEEVGHDGSDTKEAQGQNGDIAYCISYEQVQKQHELSSITYTYATQQRFGYAKIHFFAGSDEIKVPKPGTIALEISENGRDWIAVDVQETTTPVSQKTIVYTYDFSPVAATYVRISFKEQSEVLTKIGQYIGIAQIELLSISGSYTSFSTTQLASLVVNGKSIDQKALKEKTYAIPERLATVEAITKENSSLTVLPQYHNRIKLLLESEDHTARDAFILTVKA